MQESLQKQLIWLAGMTDADGNMGIYKNTSKSVNGYQSWVPRWGITTTCQFTKDVLEQICRDAQFGHHTCYRPSKVSTWNDQWIVGLQGIKRTKKVLDLILPYLVTKRNEAEMILKFITSRQERGRTPYTAEEKELVEAIKGCKQNRNLSVKSSETTCSAPVITG